MRVLWKRHLIKSFIFTALLYVGLAVYMMLFYSGKVNFEESLLFLGGVFLGTFIIQVVVELFLQLMDKMFREHARIKWAIFCLILAIVGYYLDVFKYIETVKGLFSK